MAKIFVTDRKSRADVIACEVNQGYKADLLVYVVDHDYQAKGDEKWFLVDRESRATKKLFWDKPHRADLKIYFVKHSYQAKWKKSNKWKGRL